MLIAHSVWEQISDMSWITAGGGLVLILTFVALVLALASYRRCTSHEALVVHAKNRGLRAMVSRGGFVWPWQACTRLSLEPVRVEIPVCSSSSADNLRVNLSATALVAVGTEEHQLCAASMRLAKLRVETINQYAADVITGQIWTVISSLTIRDIVDDRETLVEHCRQSSAQALHELGLQLLSFSVADLSDDNGYIESIGQQAAAKMIYEAQRPMEEVQQESEWQAEDRETQQQFDRRRAEIQLEAEAITSAMFAEAQGYRKQLEEKAAGLKVMFETCGGVQAAQPWVLWDKLDALADDSAQTLAATLPRAATQAADATAVTESAEDLSGQAKNRRVRKSREPARVLAAPSATGNGATNGTGNANGNGNGNGK